VPGTCWGGAVQPGLPALIGRYARCLAPFGRGGPAVLPALDDRSDRCLAPVRAKRSSSFASIGRRSVRCLAPVGQAAPVGRAVISGVRNAPTVWRQVATAKPQPSAAKRWTAARERLHRLATGGYPRTGGYRPGLQLTHSVRIANLDA
jgi:hypothetical protein